MPTEAQVEVASDAFRLLADPTRIKLLWACSRASPRSRAWPSSSAASPTAVSQHLSKLRWAKLVRVRREGTFAYYSAADDHVARLLAEALYTPTTRSSACPTTHRRPRLRHRGPAT